VALRVDRAVTDMAVAADVVCKCRASPLSVPTAEDGVIIQVAETAALNSVSGAVDLVTTPQPEIDRTAGRIVAEHRRSGAAVDVDAAIGMGVDEIGAGEAVRLRHRKSILQH